MYYYIMVNSSRVKKFCYMSCANESTNEFIRYGSVKQTGVAYFRGRRAEKRNASVDVGRAISTQPPAKYIS